MHNPMTAQNLPTGQDDASTIAIVSNRGPHDFVWDAGQWVAKTASGGLVSMIEPLARQPNVAWFCCVSEPPGSEGDRDALYVTAKDQTDPELNVVPVPLPAPIYRDYYGDVSNEVLWMLHHHLVGQFGYSSLDEKRHQAWKSYMEANRLMAAAIIGTEIPIRAFLIQDYHLYPLAAMLREQFPSTPILHFIHIPFPDPSTLKLIPRNWREEILRGLLASDVVGMQTPADVRSFLSCCEELLGATVDYYRKVVITADRTVKVRAFPASINPDEVALVQATPAVAAARNRLAAEPAEQTIIRVDRLDPSKNQVLGFAAFGRMLEAYPEMRGRVRFLAFLIPSRTDLTVYREYHDAVFQEIEAVNSRFADDCGFEPIKVFYTNDRAQAFAAMEESDVLLVNSREDGMNLVAKEWAVLSRKPGVLVVSETAGVASEVENSAVLVSPLDVEGMAQAMARSLTMSEEERGVRLEQIRSTFAKWTARDWLGGQLTELGLGVPDAVRQPASTKRTPPALVDESAEWLERALVVLNRDGLHARPAAAFVRCARGFKAHIDIERDEQHFAGHSIFGVLSANLSKGTKFFLRAKGPDAAEALDALTAMLEEFRRQEG
jgi:trehalose 6-phosphate synthase